MSVNATSGGSPFTSSQSDRDFEIDIGRTNNSNVSSNLSITPDEDGDSTNKNTKKGHRREWIILAVTTSGVALGVLGVLASSFLIASLTTGIALLPVFVPLAIAGGAFAVCGATLGLHEKIASVFDSALSKLIQYFKKKNY